MKKLLDRRLTWRRHIERKKVHLKLKASSFHWIFNARSPLCLDYKVLLYNSTIKAIWTYGSQLRGNASSSNIDIIQRIQSKILRTITGAPWYIRNQNIHRDLGILTVKDELDKQKASYEKLCAPQSARKKLDLGFQPITSTTQRPAKPAIPFGPPLA